MLSFHLKTSDHLLGLEEDGLGHPFRFGKICQMPLSLTWQCLFGSMPKILTFVITVVIVAHRLSLQQSAHRVGPPDRPDCVLRKDALAWEGRDNEFEFSILIYSLEVCHSKPKCGLLSHGISQMIFSKKSHIPFSACVHKAHFEFWLIATQAGSASASHITLTVQS